MAARTEHNELSPTAKVILGMLDMRPRSGYEIKQFVDNSTRYFWAASYGQIYPELKRLEKAGLIGGTDKATGGRQRTVYKLTRKGRQLLRRWLEAPPEIYELRDEGMLKLFFAGGADQRRSAEIARERARWSADKAAQLREVEKQAERKDIPAYTVLRFGIELNEWVADWFEQAAKSLESDDLTMILSAGT